MKLRLKFFQAAVFFAGLAAVTTQAQTLAFPGALGFGANATGGRSGSVYHVTTLADSGTGSFRDAVSVANRIVVFDVGGYISLNTAVSVQGNITIAGQTAPGGGIGFEGGEIGFASRNNIICRHIRIRPGSDTSSSTDDALSFYQAQNIIVDHCSIEFAPWNNIDGVGDSTHLVTAITVQNSIIADPTGQQFGCHSESVGGNWSWFNNIFANSHNRNPLAKVNNVFINNVLYNCDAGYTTHTSTSFNHDIKNNYFVAGPASTGNFPWYQIDNNQSMYFTGNLKDSSLDGTLNGSGTSPLPGYQGGGTILSSPWSSVTTGYSAVSAASAFRRTISQTGALPLDQMDALIISQVKTLGSGTTGTGAGTRGPDGGLYTSQTQTGLGNNGYGTISGGTKPLDTDNDGIPDYFERAMGWNTNSNDAMTIQSSGYARIESYINWLADPHVTGNAGANIDLSLTSFTSGFLSSPTFSVSAPVNGTVTIVNGSTARFVPTAGFSGLGSYKFTVTDSAGSTMTLTVGVLVQSSGVTPPSAPTGLAATAGNAQVSLSWSASSGATSYNVKRATTSGGPYTTITSPTGTSYVNTGLANGTTYYYVVSAVNGGGESANSSQASATPQVAAPSAPTGLSVDAGNAVASLNWDASSGATSYSVKRATTSGGPYTTIGVDTATTSFLDMNLANGTTYYYVVSAANSGGSSANSSQVSVMPTAAASITLQAENSVLSGGTVVSTNTPGYHGTGYANYSTTGGGTEFDNVPGGTGGIASLVFRFGLTGTATRTGTLTVNGVDESITFPPTTDWTNWSAISLDVTLNAGTGNTLIVSSTGEDLASVDELTVIPTGGITPPPSAPDNFNVSAGNSQVSLSWDASSGATSYNVKGATTSGGPYTTISSPTGTSYVNTGLANGTTYYYVVSAVNANGESADSSQSGSTPTTGNSGTIQAEVASFGDGVTIDSANSGWDGTGYANFPSAGGYLQFDKVDGGTGGAATLNIRFALGGSSERTGNLIVNGVQQDITFPPTVTWTAWTNLTVNLTLVSGANNTIRFESLDQDLANIDEITVPLLPPAPTSLSAVAGNAQVVLSWVQSTGGGITQNKVYRSTNGSSGPYNLLATLSPTTGYTNTGLVNGSTYYYVVTAVNANGESSFSAYSGATPLPPIPVAPSGLAATAGNTQVSLSWTASSGATSYNVKSATTSGGPYTTIVTNTTTSYTNTGLVNGTTYYYVISAVNLGGESANSSQASATPQVPAPAAPTGLAATAGNTQVSLSWSASSGATSYRIKRSTTSGGPYSNIATNTTSLTYTNTGLANGTTYYYVVSAVNAGGESANSSQVSAVPFGAVMVAYEGFSYTAGTRINAKSGGSGWGLNWSSTTNNLADAGTNVAASLSYASQATTGGSVVFGPAPGNTLVYTRQLAATLGTSAGTNHVIWVSVLYLNKSTDTNAEARIGFYSGMVADATGTNSATSSAGTTQVVDMGRAASGSDVISLYNGTTINSSGVATPRGSSASYLLLEFVLNGTSASDQVYLWVNPNLALGAPAIGTQQASWTTADLDAINGLRFQTPATTGIVDIDEIRVGTTFSAVTAAP